MSEYISITRTNYFHVKDPDSFCEFMDRVYGSSDSVSLWRRSDKEGKTVFAFGTCGAISGLKNAGIDDDDTVDESAYDEFIRGLQEHVAEDDAVILLETGHEKLSYVTSTATILTSNDYAHIDLAYMAVKKAAEMLGNPEWKTRCDGYKSLGKEC